MNLFNMRINWRLYLFIWALILIPSFGCEKKDVTIIYYPEYIEHITQKLNAESIKYRLKGNAIEYSSADSVRVKKIVHGVIHNYKRIYILDDNRSERLIRYWNEDSVNFEHIRPNDGGNIFLLSRDECEISLRGMGLVGLPTNMCDTQNQLSTKLNMNKGVRPH